MMQMILPGLESYVGFCSDEISFEGSLNIVKNFENQEFMFLSDCNSGKLLTRGKGNEEPYIPERIKMPSGKILDEVEILDALHKTPVGSKERKELESAYHYWNAIFNEEVPSEDYRWSGPSFLNDLDEGRTIEKYSKSPFYLDHVSVSVA